MMSVAEAVGLAMRLHAGQVDKAGEPYWQHCARVRARLPDDATDDEKVAALLHDTIEDCGETVESLGGRGVAPGALTIIESLTRREGERYSEFIERIARSGAPTIRVKLADIADNSDPLRLARLDQATRERLTRKYDAARVGLTDVLHRG